MPEELRNGRHLRNGYCAHLAQADRCSWTNPGTELLLSPRSVAAPFGRFEDR
jgi:hypothetical protein